MCDARNYFKSSNKRGKNGELVNHVRCYGKKDKMNDFSSSSK